MDGDDSDSEDEELFFVVLMLAGADEADRLRGLRRQVTRQYLTRPQLMPNPRVGTPWQILYATQDDRAFVTTMGINVETFHLLLDAGFAAAWDYTPIPRETTNPGSAPRVARRSLDAAGALGLTLQYLASAVHHTSLELIFAIIPATISRYLAFTRVILLHTLKQVPEAAIRWPTEAEMAEYSEIIVERHSLLSFAFGSADGLKLAVTTADNPRIENAYFNGWHHDHSMVNVLAFSPRGATMHAALNAPGSWHDSHVARSLYALLRTRTPANYYLICDTAFPRGDETVEGRIKAPLKANSRLPADPAERRSVRQFNRQLLSYRQTAEWGMRALQGSFGRLRVPLDIEDSAGRADLVEMCVRLHNVRTNLVGIDQIRNVYEPLWRDGDDELWFDFHNIVYSEIRRRDRVSRFFRLPE